MIPPPLLKRWNSLDRATLLAYQGRALHRYLRDCVLPFSKHYAAVFRERGLKADDFRSVDDLAKLPFVSKTDLLPTPENPQRARDFALIPDPRVLARRPATILRALTRGRARTQDALGREWRPTFMTSTTGRSAEPVAFLYTQRDIDLMGRAAARIVEMLDVGADERMANLFPYAPHLAYWMFYEAARAKNIFCVGTGGGKCLGTDGNLRLMKRLKPTVIAGMPTFIYHVLQQAADEGTRLEGVRVIFLGGEKVAEGTRRKLHEYCEKLGSPAPMIVATYGFTEAKMAWAECPHAIDAPSPGFHTFPDFGIFEIIDPETGQVQPDGVGGEIVWTPLLARGTVVLRYRTGDLSEHGLSYAPCPCCGRTMPRLTGKISRVSDKRSLRFQKIKGTIIDFNELELLLDDVRGLGSWQVELRKKNNDPNQMDELVVHAARAADASEETVAACIRAQFARTFEIAPNAIEFHSAEEIRTLQKVGVAMKEEKVVDHRALSGQPDAAAAAACNNGAESSAATPV
ncbi:MAG: AMP-binding protein [Verrucomicrobia bacterium]|nr:AMP-binding protein [Verrucomicrobiota bacterium]